MKQQWKQEQEDSAALEIMQRLNSHERSDRSKYTNNSNKSQVFLTGLMVILGKESSVLEYFSDFAGL
jgi:hypothetical protein